MSHALIRNLRRVWKFKLFYLLIIPGVVFFLIFSYLPIYGILIAFKDVSFLMDFESIMSAAWIGFDNFIRFFKSYFFWDLMGNTLIISMMRLFLLMPAPIALALLINEIWNPKFKKTVQTISYLPHFISMVVFASLVKTILSSDGGFVNNVIGLFGAEPVYFLGDEKWFRWILVLSSMWKETGWASIIYLAAITGADPQLYEAARVDGAGKWKQAFYITLPSIRPVIVTLLIINLGNILNVGFEQILLLYSPAVYSVADVIDTFVYRTGIQELQYSFSTAVGLFKSLIGLFLVVLSNHLAKRLGDDGLY